MADRSVNIKRLTLESNKFTYSGDTNRLRVTKVYGILSAHNTTPAEPPLSHFPAGNTGWVADVMEGLDKGHVIQCSLSGVSDADNIVPMYPCFNQAGGIWKELENRIYSYVRDQMTPGSKRTGEMTVEVLYEGANDPRFPTAFLVTVKETGFGSDAYLYFKGQKLDRLRITHLPTPAQKVDVGPELGALLIQGIKEAKALVDGSGWKVEDAYLGNPPRLAPLADVPSRPYAMLDWLWLVQRWQPLLDYLTDGCTYHHTHAGQFHERQKQLIRCVNRMYYDGYLKSDYPNDTKEALIVGSGKRSAQVDHVWPFDDFGPNLFSNALIASGDFNNRMRTAPPKNKWAAAPGVTLYPVDKHL
jgi:hypothetical protein